MDGDRLSKSVWECCKYHSNQFYDSDETVNNNLQLILATHLGIHLPNTTNPIDAAPHTPRHRRGPNCELPTGLYYINP